MRKLVLITKRQPFSHLIVTWNEKWMHNDNPKQKKNCWSRYCCEFGWTGSLLNKSICCKRVKRDSRPNTTNAFKKSIQGKTVTSEGITERFYRMTSLDLMLINLFKFEDTAVGCLILPIIFHRNCSFRQPFSQIDDTYVGWEALPFIPNAQILVDLWIAPNYWKDCSKLKQSSKHCQLSRISPH